MRLLAFITLLGLASAVTVYNNVDVSYDILSYSSLESCYAGTGISQTFNIEAAHQVLRLDTLTDRFVYVPITDLVVGDVVQSVTGTTTVTGVSITTATPYVAVGQVFSEDTYTGNLFSPYTVTSLLRWVAVASSAKVYSTEPQTTSSYSSGVLDISYWVPKIEEKTISVALDVFNSANVQYVGQLECNSVLKNFYYYDYSLLLKPLALDVLYRSFRVMSLSDYFAMIDYALTQTDGVFFDGNNVIYDYTLSMPTCDAVTITTDDGYLVVNGLVLS